MLIVIIVVVIFILIIISIISTAGIYPSKFDVWEVAQKAQSSN